MIDVLIQSKLKPLTERKISVSSPAGKLDYERGHFSAVELIQMENRQNSDSVHYKSYIRKARLSHNLPNGLELELGVIAKMDSDFEELVREEAILEARGSTLHNKVVEMPDGNLTRIWYSVRI